MVGQFKSQKPIAQLATHLAKQIRDAFQRVVEIADIVIHPVNRLVRPVGAYAGALIALPF